MIEQSIILSQIIFIDIILAADNAIIIDAGKGTVTLDALKTAENERKEYENKYNLELAAYNSKNIEIDSLNTNLEYIKGLSYKATMDYLFQKAEVDGLKYLYEDEIVHSKDHSDGYHTNYIYEEKYFSELEKMNALKLEKENYELQVSAIEKTLKALKSDLKLSEEELNKYLKEVDLLNTKLTKLDRSKMSYLNQLGDLVRDLPILDFMDPYYRVNQVVAHDIKYDVNFASVPSVDRCTSCHLGIDNADYKDAPQPFTSHPDLDLFVSYEVIDDA